MIKETKFSPDYAKKIVQKNRSFRDGRFPNVLNENAELLSTE